MGTMTVATATAETAFRSSAELREVLDRLLSVADSDARLGPLLRAAHIRTRFEFSDLQLHLNVASSELDDHFVDWSFSLRSPWQPKVTLRMDSPIANRWLQGRESLAIAIARGHVRCVGETRSTLFFIPVAKLLTEPYRRLIEADYAHLRLA